MTAATTGSLVSGMIAAFQRGDLDAVGAAFAPDASWEVPGSSVVSGTYVGPAEILGFLGRTFELSGGTLRLELIDLLESEWGAAHLQRITASNDGRELDMIEVLHHTIDDGKIVRTYHRPDQDALKDFFG